MGYYSIFSLSVNNVTPKLEAHVNDTINALAIFEDGDCYTGWSAYEKWYNCEEDLIKISQRFPSLLFTLDVFGDN